MKKKNQNLPTRKALLGGGTLSKGNLGELERFNKNKKQKKIILGSIVGVIAIIGAITLYRTYALYEEKKEFNVLKGTIPDFGYDIKMLSVVVDDKKEDSIPARGLYKTNVDCTNGTRGSWDYNAWNLVLENVSSNAKCNITFTSNLTEDEYNKYIEAGKALRRNTYRGKDITSYHNDGSLYTMIQNGTFDDIYVGDYIVANNVTWLVADIDNYLYVGEGDKKLIRHHLTMIPATSLMEAAMNDTDTTEGGYYNSKMKQTVLSQVFNDSIQTVFLNHILNYSTYLTDSVDSISSSSIGHNQLGTVDSIHWYESQVDLMSEANVYGSNKWSSSALDIGEDNRQYALFQLKPELINTDGKGNRFGYWLKNISSSSSVAYSVLNGNPFAAPASRNYGVRPRFLIG